MFTQIEVLINKTQLTLRKEVKEDANQFTRQGDQLQVVPAPAVRPSIEL